MPFSFLERVATLLILLTKSLSDWTAYFRSVLITVFPQIPSSHNTHTASHTKFLSYLKFFRETTQGLKAAVDFYTNPDLEFFSKKTPSHTLLSV